MQRSGERQARERKDKPRKDDGRQHGGRQHDQHGLLLFLRNGRNREARWRATVKMYTQLAAARNRRLPATRTPKSGVPDEQDERAVDGGEDDVGNDFAEDDLARAERRNQELLERAELLFPRDGERGEERGDHEQDDGHEPGHEIERALLLLVVKHALGRRSRPSVASMPSTSSAALCTSGPTALRRIVPTFGSRSVNQHLHGRAAAPAPEVGCKRRRKPEDRLDMVLFENFHRVSVPLVPCRRHGTASLRRSRGDDPGAFRRGSGVFDKHRAL